MTALNIKCNILSFIDSKAIKEMFRTKFLPEKLERHANPVRLQVVTPSEK
jgi:hypothetical protein